MTGTAFEHTPQGTRAVADAAVNLWVNAGRYGYSYWWANGPVHTAADGTFQLPNLPAASGTLLVFKSGYAQQCAVPPASLDQNPNMEVALVARANIIVDPAAVPASVPGRIVSGRIVQNTQAGTAPVVGAYVGFEPFPDYPAAITYSDADGRYLLCGVTDGSVGVEFEDRYAYVTVPHDRGLNVSLDIVVP